MKCEIIKDLLPLYCDDALSDVSKQEVEKHIIKCTECQKVYEDMKYDYISLDTASKNIEPMKKVKKRLGLNKLLIALLLLFIISLGTVYELFSAHPKLATSDQITIETNINIRGVKYVYPSPENVLVLFSYPFRNKEEKDITIDKTNNCVYVNGEKLLDDKGEPVPASGKVVQWGWVDIAVHVETAFKTVKVKHDYTNCEIAEFRPCLRFGQDKDTIIQNKEKIQYFSYPLEKFDTEKDTTLKIHCKDKDIVIKPYDYSGMIIED